MTTSTTTDAFSAFCQKYGIENQLANGLCQLSVDSLNVEIQFQEDSESVVLSSNLVGVSWPNPVGHIEISLAPTGIGCFARRGRNTSLDRNWIRDCFHGMPVRSADSQDQ